MNAHRSPQITRPGGNLRQEIARRVGAPNTQLSGENPMLGTTSGDCVFCRIVTGQAPATVVRRWAGAVAIVPRDPVTPGHVLVIPTVHVADVGTDTAVSALVMAAAAELAGEHPACNIITSRGAAATQTVFHLHIHLVPRHPNDKLPLPWTPQQDNTELAEQVWTLSSEINRLVRDLTAWRTDHARLRAERDALARESDLREQEIITLTVERDRLEARLSGLDAAGGEVSR